MLLIGSTASTVRPMLSDDTILKCTVTGRAGSGHYGSVLLAKHEIHDVAIKLALHPDEHLTAEAAVMRAMTRQRGFPTFMSYHQAVGGSQFDALCMQRLGPTIFHQWRTMTARTQLPGEMIRHHGIGLVRCLCALHSAGFVHNDINPKNVLLGALGSGCEGEVHLIDFGLATRSDDGGRRGNRGTPTFASLAAHRGEPTRGVDDLESLVYCLAYLAAGRLPWVRKADSTAAYHKRRMLTEGCGELVEEVPEHGTAEALQALWAEVQAQHEGTAAHTVNYDACVAALELR